MIFNFYVFASAPMPKIEFIHQISKPQQEQIQQFILSLQINQKIPFKYIPILCREKSWFICQLQYQRKEVAFAFSENTLDQQILPSNLAKFQQYLVELEFDKMPNDITFGGFSFDGKNVVFESWILKKEPYYITADDEKSYKLWKDANFQWMENLVTQLKFKNVKQISLSQLLITIKCEPKNEFTIYTPYFEKDFFQKIKNHGNEVNLLGEHNGALIGKITLGSLNIEGQKITFKSNMIQKENPTVMWNNYKANREEYTQERQNILSFINGLYKLLPDKEGATIIAIGNMEEINIIYNKEKKKVLELKSFPISKQMKIDFSNCETQAVEEILKDGKSYVLELNNENIVIKSDQGDQKAILCQTKLDDKDGDKNKGNNKEDKGIGTAAKIFISTIILGILGVLLYYFKRKINKIQDVDETTVDESPITANENQTTAETNQTTVIKENNR